MTDNGPGGRQRLSDRERYERTGTLPNAFTEYWNKPDVKGLLHAMQGRVCAYCGMSTNALDVEHFRPKGAIDDDVDHGGYWWLAYECSNLLLSCTVCNRIRKRAGFPVLPGSARCTYETREAIATERRVLPDPAEDCVEQWLTIDSRDLTGKLVPNPSLSPDDQERVQDAIDLLALNADLELRRQRSVAFQESLQAADERRWDDLRKRAMRHRPHSLVAITVLRKMSVPVPSAQEEMEDLFDVLWSELTGLVRELQGLKARSKRIRPLDERQLSIMAWALTALTSDPPFGESDTAEAYLTELLASAAPDVRSKVVALFGRLMARTHPTE